MMDRANRSRLLGSLFGLGALALASAASAATLEEQYRSYFMEIMNGVDGDEGENAGPGNEQAASVSLTVGSDVYVLTYYMNSATQNGNYQCYCNSIRLSPGEMPEVVANNLLVSYSDGERQCNHPDAAAFEDWDVVAWVYGSDHNNANVQAYARVTDHMCNEVVGPVRFSADANNNEGAADIMLSTYSAVDTTVRFSAGYLSQGLSDRTYFRELLLAKTIDGYTLTKGDLTNTISPANIGRAHIATNRLPMDTAGGDFTLLCAAKGDNRPPEDGVMCAGLNSETGEIYWKEYVQESDPGNHKYANQPSVAFIGGDTYVVGLIESGGNGDKDVKGPSTTHVYFISASPAGFSKLAHVDDVGPYQAHSAICAGKYGTAGAYSATLMDASITGLGQPALQMIGFDAATKMINVDKNLDSWIINAYNGDSGYLANIYGNNPNSQGRDFLRCTGDVPNPSYGKDVGFKPNVKSFFIAPHAGRAVENDKNAMFVSFVPAEVDAKTKPGSPTNNEGPTSRVPTEELPTGEQPTGPSNADPIMTVGNTGGCAMSSSGSGPGAPWALLLGLGLLGALARRREVCS